MTLSRSEQELLDTLTGEIASVEERLERRLAERLAPGGYARHATPHAVPGTYVSGLPSPPVAATRAPAEDQFFLSRLAKLAKDPHAEGCDVERDVVRRSGDIKNKALSLGTPTAGGHVVPEEEAGEIIELLRAESVVFRAGARIVRPRHTPYRIPRMSATGAAGWLAEGASITSNDPAFDEVVLNLKKVGRLNVVSNELIATADPDIEAILREDLARTLALALDNGALQGDGMSGAPTGVVNTSSVLTQAVSATPTYEELQGFVAKLRNADALRGSLAWCMAPESWAAIEAMKDEVEEVTIGSTTGLVSRQPLLRRSLTDAMPDRLLGYPVLVSSQLPATVGAADSIIFGNWNDLIVGQWQTGLRIETSMHANFSTDQIAMRALLMCDVAVRHPQSFCIAT